MKEIGTRARPEIEHLLGHPVFLELQVKVRPKLAPRRASARAARSLMAIELVYETHSTSTRQRGGDRDRLARRRVVGGRREQARALGERRRDDGLAVVFTSDLGSAIETADIAFAGSDCLVRREDARLRECNYGELNGHPVAEIDAIKPTPDRRAVSRRRELPRRRRADALRFWAIS